MEIATYFRGLVTFSTFLFLLLNLEAWNISGEYKIEIP